MNAKEELLNELEGEMPLCAYLGYAEYSDVSKTILLKKGYTQKDWNNFLAQLDFEYDDGYGTQHLFGTVWISETIWMDRYEYDGSESWQWLTCPEIPEELL